MRKLRIAILVCAAAAAGCADDTLAPTTWGERPAALVAATGGVAGSATGSAHLLVFDLDQCLITNPGCPSPPGIATRNFTFTAQRNADGTVIGQWQLVAGGTILHGSIDCLTIAPDGSSARLSGLVDNAHFAFFQPGTAFAMEVYDNGNGASGDPDVTTQLRAFRNAAPEVGRAFCETGAVPAGGGLDPLPSEQGNVTIHVRQ